MQTSVKISSSNRLILNHFVLSLSLFLSLSPPSLSLPSSPQVVRMALQVVSILSSSKGALEVDGDIIKDPSPSSSGAKQSDHKGADSTPVGNKFSSSKSQLSRFSKASSTTTASATKAVDGGGVGVAVGGATGEVTPLNKYFRTFLVELLRMFATDCSLLDNKGSFVIRYTCIKDLTTVFIQKGTFIYLVC